MIKKAGKLPRDPDLLNPISNSILVIVKMISNH